MVLKKRVIIAGFVCTFTTSQVVMNAEDKSAKGPDTSISSSTETLQTAPQAPVLLAPPSKTNDSVPSVSAKNPDATATGKVSPTSKLTPAEPLKTSETNSNGSPKPNSTPKLSPKRKATLDFVPLLTGTGLEGWTVQEGRADAWERQGNIISCRGTGGGWLRTVAEYSDFHLLFDYRLQAGGNTGLGIRCPSEGNPTFTGIELQLLDETAEKYKELREDQYTGSIYYHAAPITKPKLNPPGEWNSCEVICIGDQLTVKINSVIVNEVNLAQRRDQTSKPAKSTTLAHRPPLGHLALQSHPSSVDFRNLVLKDLARTTDSGVRYVEIAEGEGDALSEASTITVHYVGQLLDGTRFGDTRDLGDPVTVPVTEVIDGWRFGIEGMKVGGRRRLIVPPELAYGSEGVTNLIPPGATLVFEVELCDFER